MRAPDVGSEPTLGVAPARVSAWRMVGIGTLLLVVIYVLTIWANGIVFGDIVPLWPLVAAILAYLIGVRRLALVPPLRAWAEALGTVVALVVIMWPTLTYVFAPDANWWTFYQQSFLKQFSVVMVVGGALGMSAALLAGTWHSLRPRDSGGEWRFLATQTFIAGLFILVAYMIEFANVYENRHRYIALAVFPAIMGLVWLVAGCLEARRGINLRLARAVAPTPSIAQPASTYSATTPPPATPPVRLDPNE